MLVDLANVLGIVFSPIRERDLGRRTGQNQLKQCDPGRSVEGPIVREAECGREAAPILRMI